MKSFKHYILTRFNVGIYNSGAQIRISTEQWMQHRIKLFMTFNLPSIMGQSCQNFTWLVLIDKKTPAAERHMLEGIHYPNMKLIYSGAKNPWIDTIEPGDYDLITTRIDNDDAFHKDVIKVIQNNWCEQNLKRSKPWVMVFPYGLILDLATKQLLVMEYWFNNCPTLVENSHNPRTIWQWDHSNVPCGVEKCYIKDKLYWLQVIHSQNLKNIVPIGSPTKIIHRDISVRIESLANFGVDVENLPGA